MKVAFVVQRYGTEVAGGSETLCRQIAERMGKHWDVEVLTTCAQDYLTWRDHYEPGVERLNGVRVRRFRVDFPRTRHFFRHLLECVFSKEGCPELEERWAREQGPYSSEFLRYLEEHGREYDLFIFFTYLYGLTFFGLPLVAERSLLVPTAHDEDPFHLGIFKRLFALPKGFLFLSPEEQALVQKKFQLPTPGAVLGCGIDDPGPVDSGHFRREHGGKVPGRYIVYVGRIDPCKGCRELFADFARFRASYPGEDLKLVLAGKNAMEFEPHPDIVPLGYVDEATKLSAIAGAEALVMSSPFESLSMVLLEAWMLGKPVLVNAQSDVLEGQALRSGGGLAYRGTEEFAQALRRLLDDAELRRKLGASGRAYVETHYLWDKVEERLLEWGKAYAQAVDRRTDL